MDRKTVDRKNMKEAYRQRPIIGGVSAVINSANGRMLIESDVDISSKLNRFQFAKASGNCIYPRIQADWAKYGPGSFSFEVLERLEKPDDQDIREFAENIALMERIWVEKTDPGALY